MTGTITRTARFPKLTEAVAVTLEALNGDHAASFALSRDRQNRDLKLAARLASAAHSAASMRAYTVIGDELLPALFGGKWKKTSLPLWADIGLDGTLIDHQKAYRLAGMKGPTTWRNSVIVSEPYNAVSREGKPTTGAIADAAYLRAKLDVGVWVSRDLSPHFPGWTSLVLLAGGMILPEDAGAFGFMALA